MKNENDTYETMRNIMKTSKLSLKRQFKIQVVDGGFKTDGNLLSFAQDRLTALKEFKPKNPELKKPIEKSAEFLEDLIIQHNKNHKLFLEFQNYNKAGLEERNEIDHLAFCLSNYLEASANQIFSYGVLIEHYLRMCDSTENRWTYLLTLKDKLLNHTINSEEIHELEKVLECLPEELEPKLLEYISHIENRNKQVAADVELHESQMPKLGKVGKEDSLYI